jgi:carboxylesterase
MFFRRRAVLVIHGLSGGIMENECLVNHLQYYDNLNVYAFTLPGHSQHVKEKVCFQDWIRASKEELEKLIIKHKEIYIVGHSMGAVIASYLASRYKEVKKLVLIAPAFEYINLKQNKEDLKEILKIGNSKHLNRHQEESYHRIVSKWFEVPIPLVIEFVKLVKKYKRHTNRINCSTLILHAGKDEIIPLESAMYAMDTIKCHEKYLTIIKGVKHGVLLSKRKNDVCQYISSFLRGGLKWKKMSKLEL